MNQNQRLNNRITQPEFYRLCCFLEENKREVETLQQKKLIDRVREAIGLNIDRGALVRAADALDADWILPSRRKSKTDDRERIIASAILELYTNLEMEPPKELDEIANNGR